MMYFMMQNKNVYIFSAYVNHRPYFRRLAEKYLQKKYHRL